MSVHAASSRELSTEPRAGQPSVAGDGQSFVIEVIEGAETGARFNVEPAHPARLLIGSSAACEIRLSDRQVSRRHAALEPAGERLRLTDLGSKNGTTVQGLAVVDAFLCGGEVVHVGGTGLRVERVAAASELPVSTALRFGRVIGASFEMRRLYPLCERLASRQVPVIIEGETGTGKERLAEALHELGPRANQPFVVFDCTTVAPSLVESALFGHERGAFTGATESKRGVFELADGGTLLIDEIGELDASLQAKLLRAIERNEIKRVGADRWQRVDVRVIAATRRDLEREIQAGRFRDDLFYRLAVARIELPPLRRRSGDVGVLARHFWRSLGGAGSPDDAFLQRLESYDWPGNVRELHNAVLRRISLGELDDSGPVRGSVPPPPEAAEPSADAIERVLERDLPFPLARDEILGEFERRYVDRLLARYAGSVSRAAAASGIALRYFQRIRARQTKSKP
jgi:two-component system, NtrC family, response regulator HydG